MHIIDSYDLFIKHFSSNRFSEDAFIEWGLQHIIFVNKCKAKEEWENIKKNWQENKNLCIRNSGKNGQSSQLYTEFYAQFGKTINFDKTNNQIPTKTIQEITGLVKYNKNQHDKKTSKNQNIKVVRNYQVSHIWGHTKNPLMFVCPWNICLVPKMFDPFTGHEAKGPLVEKFQKAFIDEAKTLYTDLINDYNEFIEKEIHQSGLIDKYIDCLKEECRRGEIKERMYKEFSKNIKEEFAKIEI